MCRAFGVHFFWPTLYTALDPLAVLNNSSTVLSGDTKKYRNGPHESQFIVHEIQTSMRIRDGNESVGQWVTASDPLTHDDEITAQ